jgi:hypothetical protein
MDGAPHWTLDLVKATTSGFPFQTKGTDRGGGCTVVEKREVVAAPNISYCGNTWERKQGSPRRRSSMFANNTHNTSRDIHVP